MGLWTTGCTKAGAIAPAFVHPEDTVKHGFPVHEELKNRV